ncbi:MAG: fused MFS/spermidine synthase [Chloroflexi bacterium]|nr:fused MFS/spermidine synthase [Chloroflexota bacterium]
MTDVVTSPDDAVAATAVTRVLGSLRSPWSEVLVGLTSMCTLVIELVAGRILAPYIGVSLYTWTTIIGVVLAGITIGNYLGGWLADRYASRRALGVILLASAISSIAILPITSLITKTPFFTEMGLISKIVIYTTVIFFPPGCILGMISPLVVKLTLTDLAVAGNVVGRIYAVGAFGSILGTFLTGFYLIALLGTRTIVWLVAGLLFALALIFGQFGRRTWAARGLILVVAAGLLYTISPTTYAAPCWVESHYYCIRIDERELDGRRVRQLVLDHLVHSYNAIDDPLFLGYGYERVYAEATAYVAADGRPMKAMFIGGGGFTYPRYVWAKYPNSTVEVLELDPQVTRFAYQELGVPNDPRIVAHDGDARQTLEHFPGGWGTYDVILGDAFNDLSIPYHLTTLELNQKIHDLLKPDGMYLANVIDNYQRRGEFLKAYGRTLGTVFKHVYLLAIGEAWKFNGANTFVIAASDTPLDVARFRQVVSENGTKPVSTAILSEQDFRADLAKGPQIVLTDEYAPVDNMVAPLFTDRGF